MLAKSNAVPYDGMLFLALSITPHAKSSYIIPGACVHTRTRCHCALVLLSSHYAACLNHQLLDKVSSPIVAVRVVLRNALIRITFQSPLYSFHL